MRLAILGTRGVPASYGGFETFAEELGARLVERGHKVTVYGRSRSIPRGLTTHRGIDIVRLPAPRSKYLETVVHTIFSAAHAARRDWDAVYVCNLANVPAALLLRAMGQTVILNVDGLEWQRAKWSAIGRLYYRLCAWLGSRAPIELVSDARVSQRFYRAAYGRPTHYFPYGTDLEPAADDGTLARLRLKPRGYVLYVSRLEPENNAQLVVDAFSDVRTDMTLALVGDAPYASQYIRRLKETAALDRRVVLLGGHYGNAYQVLRSNAAAYVQATEVGGTHPALVEAMGYGNAIAANDVPEHREVLGDAGLYYRGAAGLTDALQRLLDDEQLNADLRARATNRARTHYSWDTVADAYEAWLDELTHGGNE